MGGPLHVRGEVAIGLSLLAADPLRIGESVELVREEVDLLHLDVMDGHFVPNLSYGPELARRLKESFDLPLDVHLMVEEPERFLPLFWGFCDYLVVHVEATYHLHRCLQSIRAAGVRAGVALNPGTHLLAVEPVLEMADLVLVMSVNPGFGGQSFIPSSLDRVRDLRRLRDERGLSFIIAVDGGVKRDNAFDLAEAGCELLISGSGILGAKDPVAEARLMREEAQRGVSCLGRRGSARSGT